MTNPNDPWSNPYGQPSQQGQPQYTQPLYGGQPEGQRQYGEPQYGQQQDNPQYGQPAQYGDQQPQYGGPPQYGTQQYGTQPYGQYGQGMPPFGTPPSGAGPRPSSPTLIIAGVIQIVQAAFWVIIGVIFIAVANTLTDILNDAGLSNDSTADVKTVAIVAGLIIVAIAVTMIVLAALTMRRSNGCRIASIVLEILFGVFYVLTTFSALNRGDNPAFPLLFLASCVAVVVLLFTSSAKAATGSS